MSAPEQVGALRDQQDVRTQPARFRHRHDILATARLGLLGAGNDDRAVGRVRLERDDPHGPPPERRHGLLHDRGKEAIKVEIEAL